MSISALLHRRLRLVLALLVLVPTLVLAVGGTQAKAASWTTMASGWSTGFVPAVGVAGTTKANPDSVRIQVTNYATKTRPVEVSWFRSCVTAGGTFLEADGIYRPRIGAGNTHTKYLFIPASAVECYVSVGGSVDSPVKGKILMKVQATY